MTREERDLKKYLRELTAAVTTHLRALDEEMHKPSDVERGKRIGALANALDYANDRARYFGLGVDFRTHDKGRGAPAKPAGELADRQQIAGS